MNKSVLIRIRMQGSLKVALHISFPNLLCSIPRVMNSWLRALTIRRTEIA